jgi:hypothetical protein
MLDRSRRVQLGWSAICLGLFVLLAVGVSQGWTWLADLDEPGQSARDWAIDDNGLRRPLRVVEVAFSGTFMAAYSLVLAVLLWARNHRRAAAYFAGVMAATGVAHGFARFVVDRDRPEWQDATGYHATLAFPSDCSAVRPCCSWCLSASTGCCSAATTPPTSLAARSSGWAWPCSGWRSTVRCRAATR